MVDLESRDLLAALELPGVGSGTLRNAIRAIPNDKTNKNYLFSLLEQTAKSSNHINTEAELKAYEVADKIIFESENSGIQIITPYLDNYPPELQHIPDFPPLLYSLGDNHTLRKHKKIAVVGTRKASKLGRDIAQLVSYYLSSRDICVVSGLALGIDTVAHKAALNGRGSTIAVLAHGLDQIAPSKN